MKIYVFCNQKDRSRTAYNEFIPLVKEFGYEVSEEFMGDEDLLACIGGDGTFLSFVHKCGFPKVPIIGILSLTILLQIDAVTKEPREKSIQKER